MFLCKSSSAVTKHSYNKAADGWRYKVQKCRRSRKVLSSYTSHMTFHVERKMIWSWEGAFTQMALEGTITGVFPVVTGKFIWACELPAASFPVAVVRFLPGVCPKMSFQMWRFCVGLSASWVRAGVSCGTLATPCASTFPSDYSWSCCLYLNTGICWGIAK